MDHRKPKPEENYSKRFHEITRLRESVLEAIGTAEEQIARSRRLVAHSQKIIARLKQSLAHTNRIQRGITNDPHNPVIASGREPDD